METQQQIDISQIENNVREWTYAHVAPDFNFRPKQFETIVGIIYSILNVKLENNIIQAPTGIGKSFICIISAGVLADCYNIKSYILASDLFLWKQYADAIDKYNLSGFGYMKGSLGNYRCTENDQDYEFGECKKKRVPLSKFRKDSEWVSTKWPCHRTCQYMIDRFRAEKSKVTLLTYQLWLYQMNLVRNTDEGEGFTPRDVIFCDECHNIPDIISRFAQPKITAKFDKWKIIDLADYGISHKCAMPYYHMYMTDNIQKIAGKLNKNEYDAKHISCDTGLDIKKVGMTFDYIVDTLNYVMKDIPLHTKRVVKVDILTDYIHLLEMLDAIAEDALKNFEKNSKVDEINASGDLGEVNDLDANILNNTDGSNNQKRNIYSDLRTLSWIHNYYSSFNEFIKAVEHTKNGHEYIVIEKTEDDDMMPTFTFYYVQEDELCKEYLLNKAKHKVMTSATVGNIFSFMKNIGIKEEEIGDPTKVNFTMLPNIFDFSQSPIFYIPNYKMSFREKTASFPEIQKIIYKICEMYPDVHGMINTGSYVNSKIILNNAPPKVRRRLCAYDSAKDKDVQIRKFQAAPDKILIGPTLVEGVDLPGDLCRFIIIAKLPYPNISSPLTKAKMELYPLWYSSTTSNTMIQNIGRGVRFQGDWCYTFILDGCFDALYNQTFTQYSPEIQQRFIRVTPEYIEECYKNVKK